MSNYARSTQIQTVLNSLSASIQRSTGFYTPPIEIPAFPTKGSEINYSPTSIQGSTVGAVNTGSIVGQTQISVTLLKGQGADELADAIAEITSAIEVSTEVADDLRAELLSEVAFLADQATQAPEGRQLVPIKAVLSALQNSIGTVAGLAAVWDKVGPIISQVLV